MRVGQICAAAVGVSLSYLYLSFITNFLFRADLSLVTSLQFVIILTQVVRLLVVLIVPELRFSRVEVVFVLFSLETFVVLALIGIYLVFPDPTFSSLGHEIFSTWMTMLFCVTPPYLILWTVLDMARNRSLTKIAFGVVSEFSFLLFLLGILSEIGGRIDIGTLFDSLIVTTRGDMTAGVNPLLLSSVVLPSAAIYCSLLVYAALPQAETRVSISVAVLIALASAVVASGWIAFTATLTSTDTLLSYTAPPIVIAAALWWLTRR